MSVSIKYTPAFISKINVDSASGFNANPELAAESIALVEKFQKHLTTLKEWKERVGSLNYLAENAKSLAGNIEFETKADDINESLKVISSKEGIMDFDDFVEAIDVVIQGYKHQALMSITGASKNV